jgi:hypothetical protein
MSEQLFCTHVDLKWCTHTVYINVNLDQKITSIVSVIIYMVPN